MHWRAIPGFDRFYEINDEGEVRSWRCRGRRAKEPHLLTAYMRHHGKESHARYVKLTDSDGVQHEVKVLTLVIDVWLGGCPDGMVAYHKNGNLNDNYVGNIGFTTKTELGKKTGGSSRRRAVAKIAETGETVAFYRSAREAARRNYMSYQTVLDRCNRRVKKPMALDGFDYRWAK